MSRVQSSGQEENKPLLLHAILAASDELRLTSDELRLKGVDQVIENIGKMTQQERLQTMEALWDALTHNDPKPVSPAWHEEILASGRTSSMSRIRSNSAEAN